MYLFEPLDHPVVSYDIKIFKILLKYFSDILSPVLYNKHLDGNDIV